MTFPTLVRKLTNALEYLAKDKQAMHRFIEGFKGTSHALTLIQKDKEASRHFDYLLSLLTARMEMVTHADASKS